MVYDYDSGRLYLESASGVTFDLALRRPITIVNGDSATGKTCLCEMVQDVKALAGIGSRDASNITLVRDRDDLIKIKDCDRHLIIIDDADVILDSHSSEVDTINRDRQNHYLIFLRRPVGLRVTANYFGSFVRTGKTVTLEYMASVQGWF